MLKYAESNIFYITVENFDYTIEHSNINIDGSEVIMTLCRP